MFAKVWDLLITRSNVPFHFIGSEKYLKRIKTNKYLEQIKNHSWYKAKPLQDQLRQILLYNPRISYIILQSRDRRCGEGWGRPTENDWSMGNHMSLFLCILYDDVIFIIHSLLQLRKVTVLIWSTLEKSWKSMTNWITETVCEWHLTNMFRFDYKRSALSNE